MKAVLPPLSLALPLPPSPQPKEGPAGFWLGCEWEASTWTLVPPVSRPSALLALREVGCFLARLLRASCVCVVVVVGEIPVEARPEGPVWPAHSRGPFPLRSAREA